MSTSCGDWLQHEWAINPEPCMSCGRSLDVGWWKSSWGEKHWCTWCSRCQSGESIVHHCSSAIIFIGEVRPTVALVEPGLAATPWPEIAMWTRSGHTASMALVDAVLIDLRTLAQARQIYARRPGQWNLEVRDDGRLWAPWCPIGSMSWLRSGDHMPYTEGCAGASKNRRTCMVCDASIVCGDRVWRPDPPVKGLQRSGWDPCAKSRALVCHPCAQRATLAGVEGRGEIVYGHLRVVGIDDDAAGSDRA